MIYFTSLYNIFFQRKNNVHLAGAIKRPKQACLRPDRLGKRESTTNHNEFFEGLSKQKSKSSSDQVHSDADIDCELAETTTCDSQNKQKVPEGVLFIDDTISSVSPSQTSIQPKCCSHDTEFKTLMIAHMTAIKEHLIRIEAKMSYQQNRNNSFNEASGIVDVTKLRNFGVSVDSEEKLLALDKKLKDEQYRTYGTLRNAVTVRNASD